MMLIFQYPIEEMIHLLCFENASEVAAFCSHYGISLKGADVMLDSKAYIEPEGSLPQTRSQSLIEIKQENMSIGEVSLSMCCVLLMFVTSGCWKSNTIAFFVTHSPLCVCV